ncbi:MAG: hypothetical protein EOO45_04275 [Flavobacterium sp.]|nr:MAG: hypothetical protein EOO45_04275 [Flavobacterium sp.]
MITQLKNVVPNISFGFGITNMTIPAYEPFTVWVDTLYNQKEYVAQLQRVPDIKIVRKISDYQFEVIFRSPGTYDVQLTLTRKNSKPIMSNILTLTVI